MATLDISGHLGNAYAIIATVESWLKQIDRRDLIETYSSKVQERESYDELLAYTKQFCAELYIDVEFVKDDDDDDDWDDDEDE